MSKLFFRYAAMNAGKSTALLQVAHNYEERGMAVRLFTAAHDDRMGTGRIGSRLGLTREADTFGPDTEFRRAHLSPAGGQDIACVRRSRSAATNATAPCAHVASTTTIPPHPKKHLACLAEPARAGPEGPARLAKALGRFHAPRLGAA